MLTCLPGIEMRDELVSFIFFTVPANLVQCELQLSPCHWLLKTGESDGKSSSTEGQDRTEPESKYPVKYYDPASLENSQMGRSRKFTKEQELAIVQLVRNKPGITLKKLQEHIVDDQDMFGNITSVGLTLLHRVLSRYKQTTSPLTIHLAN